MNEQSAVSEQDPEAQQSISLERLLSLFEGKQSIAICGHVNPDGDALGSGLALASLLRAQGHEVACLLAQDRPAPKLYRFLEGYDFLPAQLYTENPDLFVAVDSPNLDRLGDARAVFERAKHTLVIDHHPDYSGYADEYYGGSDAPATGLLVWRILKASGVEISKAMADYCYIALMTDTGRFSYQNTNQESFVAAAQMLACGVQPFALSSLVYESKSYASTQLEARLIERIRFAHEGRVAYGWVTESDFDDLGINRDETEGLPSIIRSLKGVEVAALLRYEEGKVRVNLRSKNACDVGAIARAFGGGGHRAASGFTIDTSLEEALDKTVTALTDMSCFKTAANNG
ncbi:MAG: bifunctional oligoribonuclease/PAP phosphatase NrnA [Coriobacteriales bacterium]|nr:bifunctional oligoribonuclease/PAP phosphatase NrnA [Coriobacteriales bacterium]